MTTIGLKDLGFDSP